MKRKRKRKKRKKRKKKEIKKEMVEGKQKPESTRKIIKALKEWDYKQKASAYNISRRTNLSVSMVILRLRQLKDDKIITKSENGSYYLL